MTSNLKAKLAELRELEAKAAPGPWTQGITLMTAQTRRWNQDQIRVSNSVEAKMMFANFTSEDQGRSRRFLAKFEDEKDAEVCVKSRNALPNLLSALELAVDALEYYRKHPSVIAEAYHTGVTPEQIQVVHTFINHEATKALSEIESLLCGVRG